MAAKTPPLSSGLLEACDSEQLFGVTLTGAQRDLLAAVERGDLLHVWCLGRRSGKTLLGAICAIWFCLLRPELAVHVRRRERRYAVAVATNLRQARIFVEQARSIVESSPLLTPLVESVTDDEIVFRNRTCLSAFPCTSRGGRGWPVQFLLLDEAAHQLDTDGHQAAEPVFKALMPSVAQFGTEARVIVASTPYGTDGFFADLYATVEKGDLDSATFAQASTVQMRPGFATAALELERQRDPEAHRAEYLAEFIAPGGAYLDAGRVADAVARDGELAPGIVGSPVAAIDLGFKADSTALAIVGRGKTDPRQLHLVLARSWKPELGKLGFGPTLDAIADLCLEHGVRTVYTDQYHAEAAVEHLAGRGIHATVVPTNAQSKTAMFSDLKTRIYSGALVAVLLPRRYRVRPLERRALTSSGATIPNGFAEHVRGLRREAR